MHTNQLKYYFSLLRAAPFMPLLYHQATHIKKTMPDLPAPADIRKLDKAPDTFHIMAIGESSIASIGAESQKYGITGRLSNLFESKKQIASSYEIVAKSGFRAEKVRTELLPKIESKDTDLVIIGLGANDAFQLTSPKKWKQNIDDILSILGDKFGKKPVVFINMPPILEFPIFTPLLKYFVHRQLMILKSELMHVVSRYPHVHMMEANLTARGFVEKYNLGNLSIDDFYSDGVHPSHLTYKHWADEIFEFLQNKQLI